MKRIIFSLFTLLLVAVSAEAKYWKIGPGSVTGIDFTSINAAMESANVNNGDTLYLDQYYNEAVEQTVTKQVVIIGTGYDTSLTDEQVVAQLTNTLVLKANNVVVKSVKLSSVYFYKDNCTVERCYATNFITGSTTAGMNHIYSCYITGYVSGYSSSSPSMIDLQNCVVYVDWSMDSSLVLNFDNSIINNNVIIRTTYHYSSGDRYGLSGITNTRITNNIILYTNGSNSYSYCIKNGVYASGSGNSIEHNILSTTSALSNFPANQYGFGSKLDKLFTCKGSYSDYFKLATESGDNPAVNYATDGGEVGCHGGMFGCPSGGRPQYIPYFSKVTVGSRSENGKLPVSVTIKIQDE